MVIKRFSKQKQRHLKLIRPRITDAVETMALNEKGQQKVNVLERIIMRTKLGPINIGDNEIRGRMNHEI